MAESFLCIKKPKRCLTAYNLFFHHERQKLLDALPADSESQAAGGKSRAKSKAKGGKVGLGFGPLAQNVSAKWKNITDEERAHFKALARQDRLRYDKEMLEWRGMQAKLERLLQESPDAAMAALKNENSSSSSSSSSKPVKKQRQPNTIKKDPETSEKKPRATVEPSKPNSKVRQSRQITPTTTKQKKSAVTTVARMVSNHELHQRKSGATLQLQPFQSMEIMSNNEMKGSYTQLQTSQNSYSHANELFPSLSHQMDPFPMQMLFGNASKSLSSEAIQNMTQSWNEGLSQGSFGNFHTNSAGHVTMGESYPSEPFDEMIGEPFINDMMDWNNHPQQTFMRDDFSARTFHQASPVVGIPFYLPTASDEHQNNTNPVASNLADDDSGLVLDTLFEF